MGDIRKGVANKILPAKEICTIQIKMFKMFVLRYEHTVLSSSFMQLYCTYDTAMCALER